MLCDQCQCKKNCLPLLFSKNNPQLRKMLKNLKRCEMRKVNKVNYQSSILNKVLVMLLKVHTPPA